MYNLLQPRLDVVMFEIIFPLMCFNDNDQALWEEDLHEYVRKGYDIIEDLYSPRTAAMDFVGKRGKENLQKFILFIVEIFKNMKRLQLKAIPDIWRSSAERFGDRVGLVEGDILNFSEGLRVIGIKPCEKVALFADNSCRCLVADQGIMATGAINVVEKYVYEPIKSDDVAALIYTSGTTGNPKGVILTHSNLLHQVNNLWDIVPAGPGDKFLSMLPPWHAYERAYIRY
ncbi:unnamed protein product [Lactuca virosa]|uniref:AMP-dependent synthetase/ligase domain-containing protein n=1 Tax=Lactuca virosa TaxID=75947 RepID=A0AAU9M890_9ASTR|nr:unnamed protein product [Lactuca virosa]